MQRHYELAFLVDSDQATQAHDLAERYSSTITDAGGTVHRLEHWGRRNLAYPIQNRTKAFYVLINLECDAPTRDELQRSLQFNDNILRHLLIRRSEAVTKASQLIAHQHSDAQHAPRKTRPKPPRKTRPKPPRKTRPKPPRKTRPKPPRKTRPKPPRKTRPKPPRKTRPKPPRKTRPKPPRKTRPKPPRTSPPTARRNPALTRPSR